MFFKWCKNHISLALPSKTDRSLLGKLNLKLFTKSKKYDFLKVLHITDKTGVFFLILDLLFLKCQSEGSK